MKKHKGVATLIMSIALLTVSSLILIYSADSGRLHHAAVANTLRSQQAFDAANAGMEYAIAYLQDNSSIVTASPSGGYINYTLGPATLPNNSRYTITFSNPIANNYTLLTISVAGTNDDGSSTRTIQQKVQAGSLLLKLPTSALTTLSSVKLKHDAVIRNTTTNQNIQSGSTILIQQDGHTVTSAGTSSTSSQLNSDAVQNDSSLSSMTENDYISSYFGTSDLNSIRGQSNYSYTAGSGVTDYSSTLNGITGASIYIDATGGKARVRQNTVIGSPTNPVLLVVHGKLRVAGNVTIYGYVMVIDGDDDLDEEDSDGEGTLSKNGQIIGGLATTDRVKVTKNAILTYDQSVLNNLRNSNATRYF